MTTPTPTPPSAPPPLVSPMLRALLPMVLMMWVGTNVAYRMGASGVRLRGSSTTSFDREFDRELYRIDDTFGFEVNDVGIRVVRYSPGWPPFNPICGIWTAGAWLLPHPSRLIGDVIVEDEPYGREDYRGLDVSTGTLLTEADLIERGLVASVGGPRAAGAPTGGTDAAAPAGGGKPDAARRPGVVAKPPSAGAQPPASAAAGRARPSTPAAAPVAPIVVPAGVVPVELTRRYLAENYGRLAYINESCMTFNGAYIIVLMLFGLAAAATAIPRSVRRRRAARAASAQ